MIVYESHLYDITYFDEPPTLRTQYPKVPKEMAERDEDVRFSSSTRMIEMSFTTGAVMVVTRKRAVATKRKKVPRWWKKPVAILTAVIYGYL